MIRRSTAALSALGAILLFAPLHAEAATAESSKSLLDLYKEGGPIMHLIALCSVAALALAAYCTVTYRKGRILSPKALSDLNHLMAARDLPTAYQYCHANPGPITHALASALHKANY